MQMRNLKISLLVVMSSCLVLLTPSAALALSKPEFGGNNSADYQPPTGNPQNNTTTSLQPISKTSLQPVPAGINPQSLVQPGGLVVTTSTDKGASSTIAQPTVAKKSKSVIPIWIAGGVITLLAVIYVVRQTDTKEPAPEPVIVETPVSKKPKKTKTKPKKSTRKKRRSAAKK